MNLTEAKLFVIQGNSILYSAPCAYGKLKKDGKSVTPTGKFKVIRKIHVYQGDAFLKFTYGTRSIILDYHPPWTDRHISIHGTGEPNLIGSPVSHGCIRLHNSDIENIYELVRLGDTVEIKY